MFGDKQRVALVCAIAFLGVMAALAAPAEALGNAWLAAYESDPGSSSAVGDSSARLIGYLLDLLNVL